MKNQSKVVIIGGGVMGASLLYHLCREGWSDCMLIEKAEITSGSTWHAAGQITHGLAHWGLGKINKYGVEFYKNLEKLTGQSVSWHGCGSLRIAYYDEEVDYIRHIISVGRGMGVPMEILSPDEIAKIHPFFNLNGVKAALHTPDDGHVDPAGATFGMIKGARDLGATVVRHNRVANVNQLPNGEWEVETEQGNIRCEIVVNAAGSYAKQVAAWSGYNLPMANTTHHYFVTDTVEEFQSLPNELPVVRDDMTYSGYIRMEQKSALIGVYEKTDPKTMWDDGTPWEAENELFEADYERIGPYLEKAIERMPLLEKYGIKRAVHGAIPMPPDGNMLLGPAPGLDNYWCCCGSHVGIAWGPGAGKYLAQWMVHGTAEINMRDFDPRRFGNYINRNYEIDRAKEDYVLRHEIPYPGRQRYQGRPNKTSPLYEKLKNAGAIHEEIFGWERPRWFALPGQAYEDTYSFHRADWHPAVDFECRAVRERVGIMDLSAFAKLDISGNNAYDFLNRIIANNVPKKVGGIVLTHILNEKGTIEAEVTLLRLEDNRFYMMFAAFLELKVSEWLRTHKSDSEDVNIEIVSNAFGCLVLSGPRARDVLSPHTSTSLENSEWRWLQGKVLSVAGIHNVRALRMSYQGELGWELHVPMNGLEAVYDALWNTGQEHGIANFGSYALNSMRFEKGFKGASEFTNEVTLPEADVMRFCRLDKGDFIGRDATIASQQKPLRWICAGLEIDATDADAHGSETVFADGKPIGQVSSGAYAFYSNKSMAYAYIDPDFAKSDRKLEVMVLGEKRPARVLSEPIYDVANEKPRA